jgi:hypothetical protein
VGECRLQSLSVWPLVLTALDYTWLALDWELENFVAEAIPNLRAETRRFKTRWEMKFRTWAACSSTALRSLHPELDELVARVSNKIR